MMDMTKEFLSLRRYYPDQVQRVYSQPHQHPCFPEYTYFFVSRKWIAVKQYVIFDHLNTRFPTQPDKTYGLKESVLFSIYDFEGTVSTEPEGRDIMVVRKVIFIFFFILFGNSLFADDGMWLPHQMPELNLQKQGLRMNPDRLYRTDGTGIMSAIVSLGGGTGEFVSPEGLILTNHHVAYRALQTASSVQNDYLEEGFVAWERSEEIRAPGYYADVLLSYEDVTDQVLNSLDGTLGPAEKHQALHRIMSNVASEAETAGPDLVCKVVPMYSGNLYYLFRYKRLKDIRLVYAPPLAIGNFGGETDNWMWPRHTCDFSFLRAYVSPDNIGSEYNPENIPYQPTSILHISLNGLKEGDFTFVMGYPARTYRNYTTTELESDISRMKKNLELRKQTIGFLEQENKRSKDIEIKYASKLRSLYNGQKNYEAKLEGFKKNRVVDSKLEKEQDLKNWIAAGNERSEKYHGVLHDIADITERLAGFERQREILEQTVHRYFGPELLYQAYLLAKNAVEKEKPDMDRDVDFQTRNASVLRSRIEFAERSYDPGVDQKYFEFTVDRLIRMNELPSQFRPFFSDTTQAGISAAVDVIYRKTHMTDPAYRLGILEKSPDDIRKTGDPLLQLGLDIAMTFDKLTEERSALEQERDDARALYKSALMEMNEGRLAPDANGTLRFTYGAVMGYSPRDAVLYLPFTTLKGVIEKDTGVFPFNVPNKLKQLYDEKDYGRYADQGLDRIVACFLNTTNVTGGNSGSPTLNANGEQVGIIFDMTYESVTGDYFVIPDLQRTISVDIRYVLFITEKFSGATHIIHELGF
jgi:hypothetical protein